MSSFKALTADQVAALQAVPLGDMPNKLRVAMAMLDFKQNDLAAALGFTQAYVSSIVTGRTRNPPLETTRKFADLFGCAIEDLFPARQAVA